MYHCITVESKRKQNFFSHVLFLGSKSQIIVKNNSFSFVKIVIDPGWIILSCAYDIGVPKILNSFKLFKDLNLKKSFDEDKILKIAIEYFRSSYPLMFFKIGVRKDFAIFTRGDLCWSLFSIKETPTQVFSSEYCEVLRTTFL